MNSNPCIAVVSCSKLKSPDSIIELFAEHTNVNETVEENISTYSWNISTKYYTAKVDLCAIKTDEDRCEEFNESVEAVIVYFDSNTETGLEDVKIWNRLLEDCEPDVKLLISDVCNADTKIPKSQAVEWCVKNGFELIELNPDIIETIDDDDHIIKETFGIDRILEALQSHMWSNLIMKSKEQEINKPEDESASIDDMMNNIFENEEADFNELFQQLHMMRESVQSMPVRERRQCAEQVVTAFWRAIGGDEEEINDL